MPLPMKLMFRITALIPSFRGGLHLHTPAFSPVCGTAERMPTYAPAGGRPRRRAVKRIPWPAGRVASRLELAELFLIGPLLQLYERTAQWIPYFCDSFGAGELHQVDLFGLYDLAWPDELHSLHDHLLSCLQARLQNYTLRGQ